MISSTPRRPQSSGQVGSGRGWRFPYKRPEDLAGKKIATEFVAFTRRYFESAGIPVDVEYSWGATEAKVVEGLVDGIVEITETGTTIKAHGLRIIAELLQTNTQLIANKESWKDPWSKQLQTA